jgi:DNA-directed RNA polymerase specialized sigma24 family protein
VWLNRGKLAEVSNFSGYLFIMARNEIISLLRKKENQLMAPEDTLEEQIWLRISNFNTSSLMIAS